MKSYDEFKEFYNNEMQQEIERIENIRNRNILKSSIIVTTAFVVFFFIWLLIPLSARYGLKTWQIMLACFIFINGLSLMWIWKGFRSGFKRQIIQKLLHFIDPTLKYYPNRDVGEYAFDCSDLFLQKYNKFDGEDLISGKVGNTDIKCSEINVRYTNDDSAKTIFKGLFIVADFNKYFHCQTIILPDKAEKFLGGFGKKLQEVNPLRSQLIQLEDSEFENSFVVYGTDQIEARYILTPGLMRRILDFKEKNKSDLYLSFSRNKLYIAIPLSRNLFEPKINKQIDYLSVCRYFQDLQLVIGVVEDLNLNTRIWSKE